MPRYRPSLPLRSSLSIATALWLFGCAGNRDSGVAPAVEQAPETPADRESPTPAVDRGGDRGGDDGAEGGDNGDMARYQRHVKSVRERISRIAPDTEFHVVIEKPFIVIGDESEAMVRRRAKSTVRWSVERLKRAYFPKDPDDILEIWLFSGQRSYRRHTRLFFDDDPDTPYGYYSPTHKALIMNIATGGGTLVHEIVHPFMAANFPACPDWFNEGLGSLYEQSSERDGDIVGLTNWRLEGLQQALRAGTVPSFKTLMSTTTEEFYERDPGSNYAQARYLLYYLQEKGLLHEYYRRFHGDAKRDPTGYKTLQAVLGTRDMKAFFATWKKYVLGLRFP